MLPRLLLESAVLLALMAGSALATPIMGYSYAYRPRYADAHDYKVVCYYGSWAVYRPGDGKFPVENIDPFICTHIVYGFAGLGSDFKIRSLDSWNDLEDNYGKGAFKRFTALKKQNPKLKALIAIGGWNEGSVKYSAMAQQPAARKIFADSVVDFCKKYNFDGLDLDWEYPAARGGKPEDKANFVTLLRELSQEFKPYGLLLTAAVSAGKHFLDPAYDVPQVSKYLDLINVMAYDFHGGWETRAGHHAPMYSRPEERPDERILNVNFSVNYWIEKGAPRNKLVLGMGLYGRSFTLRRAEDHMPGDEAPQKGQAGPYTREPGSLGYNEICEKFAREKWTVVKDPYFMAPYAFRDRQWVGYDDMESITAKVEFAKAMGLAGGMVWSIETDDFQGKCHGLKYPMLSTINQVFAIGGPGVIATPPPTQATPATVPTPSTEKTWWPRPSTPGKCADTPTTPSTPKESTPESDTSGTTPTSSTAKVWWPPSRSSTPSSTPSTTTSTTPTTTTSEAPSSSSMTPGGSGFECQSSGSFAHPSDCQRFYDCVAQGGKLVAFEKTCPPRTVFNPENKLCVWPESVPKCENYYENEAYEALPDKSQTSL
ncbi:chitinase-3-like protein 1 isoform X1 [Haemaphysalis longicornis]